MGQGQFRRPPQLLHSGLRPALQSRQSPCRLEHGDVRPVAVHLEGGAHPGHGIEQGLGQGHLGQQGLGRPDPTPEGLLLRRPAGAEGGGVFLKGQAAAHHLLAGLRLLFAVHLHHQAEAIQQLGPQIPLLRVHGAHQDEAGRMAVGDPLPLHGVDPHGGGVQQHVHNVILQQVDLVHVEDISIGLGQQAGLKGADALLQRPLQIQGAHHPVLGGAYGELHHSAAVGNGAAGRAGPALVAQRLTIHPAVEGAPLRHLHLVHQLCQTAHRRGLGRSFLPLDQHAAQAGLHQVEQQRGFQLFLPHQG